MADKEKALTEIAGRRWKIALTLGALMLLGYFGFILLVAFDKPLLSTLLTEGLSLGILLGASVIVLAWVLTLVYVFWANTVYDPAINKIIAESGDR